jgi:hypothetical protein
MYKNYIFEGVCCFHLLIITPKKEIASSSDTSYLRIKEYLLALIWEPQSSSSTVLYMNAYVYDKDHS